MNLFFILVWLEMLRQQVYIVIMIQINNKPKNEQHCNNTVICFNYCCSIFDVYMYMSEIIECSCYILSLNSVLEHHIIQDITCLPQNSLKSHVYDTAPGVLLKRGLFCCFDVKNNLTLI